ncbi:hypothetical protein PMIN01_03555 [Paraphaeosphaeria minitans]|uniref:Uncharacterized protein n=1 Tax=Paraphaeosphaeria minitans TaxID=565426 RepID=A0A9P6GM70_9PLEO|nr:hypothetical protein PMIN01_03555 [Paraphaeosphaeria minitans]
MDYPPPYIVGPTDSVAHSHTVILLHGRMLASGGTKLAMRSARLGPTQSRVVI